MRNLLIEILIRLLTRDISTIPKQTLTKEEEDGALAQMWQSPAFRKRVADRNEKLIYTMAGGEGMKAEPREAYLMHTGQRVENLLWARDAKAAYQRIGKLKQSSMTTAQVTT